MKAGGTKAAPPRPSGIVSIRLRYFGDRHLLRLCWYPVAILGFILIAAHVLPGDPVTFGDGADSGWTWGIDVAAARKFVFGRDIVFNYGPYGDLVSHFYDPANRAIILASATIVAAAFAASLAALGRLAALLFVALLLPFAPYTESLALVLPLPAMLVCTGILPRQGIAKLQMAALVALMPALALLPLAKGSCLVTTALGATVIITSLLLLRHRILAICLVALGVTSMVVLWWFCGQPVSALPAFLRSTISIISAHNDAMMLPGPLANAAPVLLAVPLLMALFVMKARHLPRAIALTQSAGFAATLFLIAKAGLLRQDDGHLAVAISALAIVATVLTAWLPLPAAIASGGVALALLFHPASMGTSALNWSPPRWAGSVHDVRSAFNLLNDARGAANTYARKVATVPVLPWHPDGSADIYSSGQARLLATGITWRPRPMFQSYDAITPELERLNAEHLTGAGAPKTIFFRVEAIDQRLPALEDGASWPALLSAYQPVAFDAATDLLWLRHGLTAQAPLPAGSARDAHGMGMAVTLPAHQGMLWAELDVRASILGILKGLIWRPSQVFITFTYADARQERFRVIPGMARAGFLLAPVITNTLDFLRLRPRLGGGAGKLPWPVSFRVDADDGHAWEWRDTYSLTLSHITLPRMQGPVAMRGFAVPSPALLPDTEIDGTCFLDAVDSQSVPPEIEAPVWPVRFFGWAVFDRTPGGAADTTELALRSTDNRGWAIQMSGVGRTDVVQALHLPNTALPGFDAMVDLSHLPPGRYTVLAVTHSGSAMRACRLGTVISVLPEH